MVIMRIHNKYIRRYTLTAMGLFLVLFFFLESRILHYDLYKELIRFLNSTQFVQTEEIIFSIGLIGTFFIIDQFRMIRRRKHKRDMDLERLAVVRSTIATVHDAINNSLNSMLLVKMEAEKGDPLSTETLSLFGNLIDNMAADMRSMNELEIVSKRTLSDGLSVLDMDQK